MHNALFAATISLLVLAGTPVRADQTVDYGGLNPLPATDWVQTKATGMADIDVSRSGHIWLVGRNGTIWSTADGETFVQEAGVNGFGRIAAGADKQNAGAVGRDNHTLWFRGGVSPGWSQTKASDVADVAIGQEIWIAGTNGTIWYASGPAAFGYQIEGLEFKQIKAEGFCRVASRTQRLWAVGCNGTLWFYNRNFRTNSAWDAGEWIQTEASGMADVAVDEMETLWLTGHNGSIWKSTDGETFVQIAPPGSQWISVGAGRGRVYAVRADGTVWRYRP